MGRHPRAGGKPVKARRRKTDTPKRLNAPKLTGSRRDRCEPPGIPFRWSRLPVDRSYVACSSNVVNATMLVNMNRLLIDYWREWRPEILRWLAAILIFGLFAWVMLDYYDYFDHFR